MIHKNKPELWSEWEAVKKLAREKEAEQARQEALKAETAAVKAEDAKEKQQPAPPPPAAAKPEA